MPPRRLALALVAFVSAFLLGDFLAQSLNRIHPFDCPKRWPLSIFNFRDPRPADGFWAAASILLGAASIRFLKRRRYPIVPVLVLGAALILATNAIQGVPKGFTNPIDGGIVDKVQYYRSALTVEGVAPYLQRFNRDQIGMELHTRTHPPGAVLLFVALRAVFGDTVGWYAVALALLAVGLGGPALYGLLRHFGRTPADAGFGVTLFLLLPAVQIYFCASIDAVIAGLLTVALLAHLQPARPGSLALAVVASVAASFLTFGASVLVPVLLAIDLHRRSLARSATILAAWIGFYVALRLATGFDYIAALRLASQLENVHGPRFLWQPYIYALTRIENVAEIVLFLGPAILWRLRSGAPYLGQISRDERLAILGLPVATLAVFLTGAYHTGETARCCLWLLPSVVLLATGPPRTPDNEKTLLLTLALGQTVVMQLWGNYFW